MATAEFKQKASRPRTPEEERRRVAAVRAFTGKYRHLMRSSEEFIRDKHRMIDYELELEDRSQ